MSESLNPDEPMSGRRQFSPIRALLVGVAALLSLATAAVAGRASAGPPTPSDVSAEAGFARDMQAHHAQAVQMSMIVRDRTSDRTVRVMAYEIALGQQQEQGQLFGWLAQWGLSQGSSRPPMAWMTPDRAMSHGAGGAPSDSMKLLPDGRMPGMATQADLARLEQLRGRPAEILWLKLMIAHHRGGMAMAKTAIEMTDVPYVRALAQRIMDNQELEIAQMAQMLRDRGAAP